MYKTVLKQLNIKKAYVILLKSSEDTISFSCIDKKIKNMKYIYIASHKLGFLVCSLIKLIKTL